MLAGVLTDTGERKEEIERRKKARKSRERIQS
jgi:hypothetical protein